MLSIDPVWQRQVRRHFDRAAPAYDAWSGAQQACVQDLLDDLARDPRCRGLWLDLGCGTGQLAHGLTARSPVDAVLALDLSPGMLGIARQGESAARLLPICADALALPLASCSLDGVASSFALHWTCDPDKALGEVMRVLKPGAPACLAIPVLGSLPGRPTDSSAGSALQPLAAWQAAADRAACIERQTVREYADHYACPDDWLAAVRAMGVTARRHAGAGLAGRRHREQLRQSLERVREPAGIPLRYTVWQAHLRARPASAP